MATMNPIYRREQQRALRVFLPPAGSSKRQLFQAYEISPRRRKDRLILSALLHAAAVAVLVQLPQWLPSPRLEPVNVTHATVLVAPLLPNVVPKIKIVAPPAKTVAKVEPPKLVVPPAPKVIEVAKVPPPVIAPEPVKEVAPVAEVTKPLPPRREILTDTFASGSSVPATLKMPARQVQTGGFGDPQGVKGTSDKGALRVASLGSFDLPSGPGSGNGTGGARGARGTVASAGFGDGTAGPGSGDRGRRGQIAQAGFDPVAGPAAPSKTKLLAKASSTPVEILYKPRPVYTDEARRLHLEGEVLMQVTFTAAGQLHDMRVVRSLGHGLDEAAQRAAAQIRFRPATRDGQPLDSVAVVHIVFELAE